MIILIKVYDNNNNYKFDNVSFEYGFKVYIYKYVIQNNYKCDSLNTPFIHAFTLNTYVVMAIDYGIIFLVTKDPM